MPRCPIQIRSDASPDQQEPKGTERSLIYVSRKALFIANPMRAVDEIVRVARSRNLALHITGALASTESYFVQLLEGPATAIDALMQSIINDPRHTDVSILRVTKISHRSLPNWSMAYRGQSTYVARQMQSALLDLSSGGSSRVDRLVTLLVGLAGVAPPASARPPH